MKKCDGNRHIPQCPQLIVDSLCCEVGGGAFVGCHDMATYGTGGRSRTIVCLDMATCVLSDMPKPLLLVAMELVFTSSHSEQRS